MLLPSIFLPTSVTNTTGTNTVNLDSISGNSGVGISDHLPSFLIISRSNQNHLPKIHDISKRDVKNLTMINYARILNLLNGIKQLM